MEAEKVEQRRRASDPVSKPPDRARSAPLLSYAGNAAISGRLQISRKTDPREEEADHAAKCVCGGTGTCAACLHRKAAGPPSSDAPSEAPHSVHSALRSPGQPLEAPARAEMEGAFGHDFSGVRVHTDAGAAQSARDVNAHAYTVGNDLVFAPGRYAPQTGEGRRLLAHELAHVVQQSDGDLAVQRDDTEPGSAPPSVYVTPGGGVAAFDVENLSIEEMLPGCIGGHVIGESWGPAMLLDIVLVGGGTSTILRIYDFERGQAREYPCTAWEGVAEIATFRHSTKLEKIAKQLTKAQIRALWPNAWENLLKLYEDGQLQLDDDVIIASYEGMIEATARRTLDANEAQIDEVLNAPDRVARLEDFASEYKTAGEIRDRLQVEAMLEYWRTRQQYLELSAQIAGISEFGSTPADMKMATDLDKARDQLMKRQHELETAVAFWEESFPLLKRLRTAELYPGKIEATLREIKANIQATRTNLDTGKLDVWDMDTIRQHLEEGLGRKTKSVIADEESRKKHRSWIKTGLMTIGMIALAFIPGGGFIDMAIGFAMAAQSWDDAERVGRAANSSLDPDEGLMSQAQAHAARFAAILSTILAAAGPLASGFRALRASRNFFRLSEAFPELAVGERMALARALAGKPNVVTALVESAGDEATLARMRIALSELGSNPKALAKALTGIGESAALRKAETEILKEEVSHLPIDGGHFLRYDKAGNVWLCSAFCANVTRAAKQVLSGNPVVLKDPEALQLVENLIDGGMSPNIIKDILAVPAQKSIPRRMLMLLAHLQMAEQRNVTGIAQVLSDLAQGGTKAQGARFVLAYIEAKGKWSSVNLLEFIESSTIGDRRYDAIIDYVRYQFKDWGQFDAAKFVEQIRKDLEITSLQNLKWVFNGRRMAQSDIVKEAIAALNAAARKDPAFAGQASTIVAALKKGGIIETFNP